MYQINENYQKLPGSYLFSTIAKKVNAFTQANPDKNIIRLGIGDVTQPIAPAIIEALHKAVDEMADPATFHGYAPDLGYDFLRNAIVKNDYQARGCAIEADEIFVSDGAKSDSGNIQELFGPDVRIAVCDPVYPVYVDSNVMAGRTGTYNPDTQMWSNVIYMPCTRENNFVPEFPKETPDVIYLCLPNNPTGTTITTDPNCQVIYTRNAAYSAFTAIRRPTWRTPLISDCMRFSTEVRKAAASLSTTAACSRLTRDLDL